MKHVIWVFLLSVTTLSACSSDSSNAVEQKEVANSAEQQMPEPFSNVAPEEWKQLSETQQGIILDVRTANEVARGKIASSMAMDFMGAGFEGQVKELDRNKPVYVYCASGGRSGKAMEMMKKLGFQKVYNLAGGIRAWESKGYQVEK